MVKPEMQKVIPRFLWEDPEGQAMAKALEAGLAMFCEALKNGVEQTTDVEKMPERRLDEMAWELNAVYDYNASVEQKRKWIRAAALLQHSYGTVSAIHRYLDGYFDSVSVFEDKNNPFHFSVFVSGDTSQRNMTWAAQAVEQVKNLRSVLDGIHILSEATILISGQAQRMPIRWAAAGESYSGEIPDNTDPV